MLAVFNGANRLYCLLDAIEEGTDGLILLDINTLESIWVK